MKNKTRLTFLFSLFCLTFTFAQDAEKLQKEIDQEVWKPFTEAFQNMDGEAFNALHSDDVLRANPWGIQVGEEYKKKTLEGYKRNKERGDKRTIQFWFEHRKTKADISYEVGYYKITSKNKDGERNHYARFHCVIQKIDGQWKITQDWDTNNINGHKVTEDDWLKGTPLEF